MSSGNIPLSRRDFLLLALAGLTTACGRDDSAAGGTAENTGAEPAWLTQVIGDPEAAARLGRAYLDAHPAYYRGDTLVRDIEQTIAQIDAAAIKMRDKRRVAAALQQQVRREYVQGDVEAVTGWILSVTEARLYALAAIR